MRDDLDGNHERSQPHDGAREMLEIRRPVPFESHVMRSQKYGERATHVGVQVARRRHESGEDPNDVAQKNIGAQCEYEGEEGSPLLAEGAFHEGGKPVENRLEHVLSAKGYLLQ